MRLLKNYIVNTLLVGLMMMAILLCFSSQAQAAQDGDYTYTVTAGEAEITKYTGAGGVVTIPSTLGGAPLTSIGNNAFYNYTGLTSISIPQGVTSIGNGAFFNCTGLTSISIPQGVTSIGDGAFSNCTGLTSISIPEGVTSISNGAFFGCYRLTSISIPQGVTSIGSYAFSGCNVLTSISIPQGVTSIGDGAFSNCTGLTSISLPQGVTSIGGTVFGGCTSLKSISLPQGVRSIGNSAFGGCYSLTSISLPQGVISIGNSAFYGCTGLTSIIFNSAITTIYDDANTIPAATKIISYNPSTAKDYASKYGREFEVIPTGSEYSIVPVTGLTISESTHTFNDRTPINLSAEIYPYSATNNTVTWSTSNPSVVTIKNTGPITMGIFPQNVGQAIITARTVDGRYQATCNIEVKQIGVNYTQERDILRKLGLSKLSYDHTFIELNQYKDVEKPVSFYKPKYEEMFKVDEESISWEKFCNQYVANHTILDFENKFDGMQAIAFKDENDEIIIAYRGTSDTNGLLGILGGDLGDGLWYTLLNGMSKQYDSALNFYDHINKDHNPAKKKISLTGHSLGGALAAYVSIIRGDVKAADSFNDATGWILWNTYIDNAKEIEKFTGIDTAENTSYVNMDWTWEPNLMNILGFANFNEYTAQYKLYTRNRYEFRSNGYKENEGGIHGLAAMLAYNNENFKLMGGYVGIDGDLSDKVTCSNGVYIIGNPNLILGTSETDEIMGNQSYGNYIYTGNGNDIVYGGTGNDTIVVSGTGMKRLYGRSGTDTYIIKVDEIDSTIFIDDSYGPDDVIYLKGIRGINDIISYPIIDKGMYYYLSLGNGKEIALNKQNYGSITRLQDEDNNTRRFSADQKTFFSELYSLDNQDSTLKSFRLTGEVEVQVYDKDGNLLGTHDNIGKDVLTTDYGYFYPMNNETGKYLDIDLINGDYTLKITSNGNVDYVVYDPDAQGSIFYEQKGIDLSDGSILVINSDFLNSENKFALEKDSVITPLIADEFVNAAQVNIAQTEVTLQAGTVQIVSATTSPDNALEKGVSWSVIQPSDDIVVAGVFTDENGETTVVGVSEGTAILRATAIGATDVYQEIPITVSQADAPIVSAGSYIQGSYTDIEAIIVSGTIPNGFDELYFIENNGLAVKANSIEVINEGITTVKVRARNSSSGEITKTAVVTVKIDRTEPAILGVENTAEYYIDRLVVVNDLNLEKVTINGTADFTGEELVRGKWFSEVGDYMLVAKDLSGKETTVSFKLKAMPAASDITSDSLDLNNTIRNEFEGIKYELTEERRNVLEAQISALETQWVISTGVWSVASLENVSGTVTVKVVNRLNESEEWPILLLAGYDETNKLLFIEEKNIEKGVTDYTFNSADIANAKKLKAFLWEDIKNLIPVANNLEYVVVSPSEGDHNTVPINLGAPETIMNTDGTYTTRGSDATFANKPMTIIVYKGPEVTPENVEYLDQMTANSDGAYSFNNYRIKEDSTQLTGGFKVIVGGGSIDTPLLAGIIEPNVIISAASLVQIGINPNYGDSAGIFVGLKDIRDTLGNLVPEAKLAGYQIEIDYDPTKVNVLDVIDEAHMGQFTKAVDLAEKKVTITGEGTNGTASFNKLFFLPIAITGSALDSTSLQIHYIKVTDTNLNQISVENPTDLVFNRGKILNEGSDKEPNISDAVAGLQYLAGLKDAGTDLGQVNPINMASIVGQDAGSTVIKSSVKDIIALMQYLVNIRDPYFTVSSGGGGGAGPIAPPDKTSLTTVIGNATTLIGSKTVGAEVGDVSQAAHDAFQASIVVATAVKNDASATQAQVNAQVTALGSAMIAFNNASII